MPALKLWLLSQTVNTGYDTYDSCVVAAETEEDAKTIHPSKYTKVCAVKANDDGRHNDLGCFTWGYQEDVKAEYLGEAKDDLARGVVCASFNAG